MEERWYAVYTKPRWEKKVAETLTSLNIENYCPLNRVIRRWSDRKKMVYEPLFTSYVFVRVTEKKVGELKRVYGIISIVSWLDKPAIIKDHEIETIRKFLKEYMAVKLELSDFKIDDIVRIKNGPLMESECIIVAIKNKTVKVNLPSLGYVMYAEIEKNNIEVMKTPSLEI